MTSGEDEPAPFDEHFVRAAPVREADLRTRPSRASLREVKSEARRRRRRIHLVGAPARPRRWRRLARGAGSLAVAVAVVAAAAWYVGPPPHRSSRRHAAPVVVPSYTPSPAPRTGDVFSGSLVARWPVGADGIRPPAPAAVGTFTTAQVADAYARAAALTKAALLDRTVLYGGQTAPVLRLFVPENARRWRSDVVFVMNRFDPRAVTPSSASPRVNGRMTARVAGKALRVTASYVAVYALRPVGGGASSTQLVAVRRTAVLDFYRAGATRVGAPYLQDGDVISDHAPCHTSSWASGYVPAVFNPPSTAADDGPREDFDILDPTAEPPPAGKCFNETSGL